MAILVTPAAPHTDLEACMPGYESIACTRSPVLIRPNRPDIMAERGNGGATADQDMSRYSKLIAGNAGRRNPYPC
ncbi:hypothetical protein E5D57_013530 [Metarhizium anisopliae]|nr:hypothetical protein E5D57_013530 [Metarhizium anisopliae]